MILESTIFDQTLFSPSLFYILELKSITNVINIVELHNTLLPILVKSLSNLDYIYT